MTGGREKSVCLSGYLLITTEGHARTNTFMPLITVGDTFPLAITVESTFPLVITGGKNNGSSFFSKETWHI